MSTKQPASLRACICAFVFAALCSFGNRTAAQGSILTVLQITADSLDSVQLQHYNAYSSHEVSTGVGLYKAIHFVSINSLQNTVDSGGLTVSLPFLSCPNQYLHTARMDYQSDSNYSWVGMNEIEDSACFKANMDLVMLNGLVTGNFTVNDRSFELYDLSGGIQILCETNLALFDEAACSIADTTTHSLYKTTGEPCEVVKTKVLVLYTPQTHLFVPYIDAKAQQCVQQLNFIWQNSQINNSVELAACLPFSFATTPNEPNGDVSDLSTNSTVTALRDFYKAEIVVLLVASTWQTDKGTVTGVSKTVGGGKSDCFAIVNVLAAANGSYTFSHEVSHLFGGKHENDLQAPLWARAKVIDNIVVNTAYPNLTFTKTGYTLISNMPSGFTRLTNVSNPDVYVFNRATGNTDRNNAKRVSDYKLQVADYYQDFGPILNASIDVGYPSQNKFCQPNFTLTANHDCGTEPFTYQWHVLSGTTWVPAGTTQTISGSFSVNSSTTFLTKLYKVTITDGIGDVVVVGRPVQYRCPIMLEGRETMLKKAQPEEGGTAFGADNLSVSPNPASQSITIKLNTNNDDHLEFELYDLSGKKISTLSSNWFGKGEHAVNVSLPSLASGTYVIKVAGTFFNKTERITVVR